MVARELHRLMRGDIEKHIKESIGQVYDQPMGINEAAAYLNLKPKTVYNKIREIPHKKVGKSVRFTRSELDSYMNNEISYT